MYTPIGIYVYNMRQAFEIGKKMFAKYLQWTNRQQKQNKTLFLSLLWLQILTFMMFSCGGQSPLKTLMSKCNLSSLHC